MPKNLPFTNTIPDAHYRCEGVDLGTERVSEIHFRAEDGGFFPPDQLFFVRIVDRPGQLECTSFYSDCIEAYGLKTNGKMNLKDAIASKLQQAQEKSAKKLLTAAGL